MSQFEHESEDQSPALNKLIRDLKRAERGWQCPNCGKAHSPDVKTCPESPKSLDSLAKRLRAARR